MLSVQQGLKDEGVSVPMTKLCQWFGTSHDVLQADQIASQSDAEAGRTDQVR
ncbi:hypothetical protein WCN79_17465 [Xanthomonas axonopodis pv. vasculorum]|uniref:hypothetical protein n=1 Tax=Xanthomonas axonopodis TaxID=53413 RepID=UPI003D76FD4C